MLGADDTSRAETERKRALFAWGDRVLAEIGLLARIAQADLHELRSIVLDESAAEVVIAIAEALHPADGEKAEVFKGLREGSLRRILRARLEEAKREREAQLKAPGAAPQPADEPVPNPADLVRYGILQKHIELTNHQYVAATLWILHTHVYDRFAVSPRLALISPVRGCGKTTVLKIAKQLTARARKAGSITASAVYHLTDSVHPTLLLDEVDNLDLTGNRPLKAVLNDGHDESASRFHWDAQIRQVREFSIYGPMAFAAIGLLPLPLMHRSIVIEMKRAKRELERFDTNNIGTLRVLNFTHREIEQWASSVMLASDPVLPRMLRNRPADNWRPLIAVADSIGGEWPELARQAACALSRERPDEDISVLLLIDIRDVFKLAYPAVGGARLFSADIVNTLVGIEDGPWGEWRGLRDDQQPRKLTQGELARLLAPFGIRPRTVRTSTTTARGYYKSQFEEAWLAYCPPDTPTQPGNIRYLRRG
jgi:hypothetical protein